MVKVSKILALALAVMMVVSLFAACGGGGGDSYDGTYDLIEMSEGSTTVGKDDLSTYGYDGSTLKIDGDKATINFGDNTKELTFDSEKMTLTDSSGESVDISFDGDKATVSIEGVKMVFEK